MHEWALAEAVLKTSIKIAKDEGIKKIGKVSVVLGELQDVDEEILKYALENLKAGTMADSAVFEFIHEPAEFKCRNCGHEWKLSDTKLDDAVVKEAVHFLPETVHSFVRCPSCGSRDFEVVKGRGVYIQSIRGDSG